MRAAIFPISIVAVVFCACASANEQPNNFRQLNNDEIAQSVEGKEVVVIGAFSPTANRASETFCGGRWLVHGSRAPIIGHYSIRDGQLCVAAEIEGATEQCRHVYRNAQNQLVWTPASVDINTAHATPLEVLNTTC